MSENIEPPVGETSAIPLRTSRGLSNGVRVSLVVALVLLIGVVEFLGALQLAIPATLVVKGLLQGC